MRKSQGWLAIALVLGLLSPTPAVSASPPEYQMIDLGITAAGSASSTARSINNHGQIVGTVSSLGPYGAELDGFWWHRGEVLEFDLASIAINNRGQIVGNIFPAGSFDPMGFLYERGQLTNIATGTAFSAVIDINDPGRILGYDEGPSRAFIWDAGEVTYLDFAGRIIPRAINNRGQVIGTFKDGATSPWRSFTFDRGVMTEIVDARGIDWIAVALNERGDVVGSYTEAEFHNSQAFLWRDGVVIDLPALNDDGRTSARGINNRGQIVGWSSGPGGSHAVLWDGGDVTDLGIWGNACTPWDVNESGQVVGDCWIAGESRAFLWER